VCVKVRLVCRDGGRGPAIFGRAASVVAVVLACQKLIEPALPRERVDNQNNSTINGFIYRFAAH